MVQVPENNKILIHYVHTGEIWDRNKIVVDNIFSYKVALDITRSNDNEYEPQTVDECQCRNDGQCGKRLFKQNYIHYLNVKFLEL